MNSPVRAPHTATPLFIWWAIWLSIVVGLIVVFVFLGQKRPEVVGPAPSAMMDYLGLAPLAASSLLRWLVLPRVAAGRAAFVVFVVGLALAEGCGFFGIFLSSRAAELFALSLLGLAQWVPVFAQASEAGSKAGQTT